MQDALDEALTDRQGRAGVLAFRTLLTGVETALMGPEADSHLRAERQRREPTTSSARNRNILARGSC